MKSLKIIYHIVFLCFATIAVAQDISGKAFYSIKLVEDKFDFDGSLDFSNDKSLFITKKSNEEKWVREDEDDYDFQIIFTDTLGHIVYRNFTEPYSINRSFCQKGNPVIYKDSISFDWTLLENETIIKGVICKKASTNFRGRKYEVWYAPSIATSAGPWKFFGLPGLILKVNDTRGQVSIDLKSLKIGIQKEDFPESNLKGNPVVRSEFNACLDSEWKKYYQKNQANIAKLQAEFPDLEISDNNLPEKRPATELEF